MLFSIDVGFTSLGVMMCICFIFLPTVLLVVDFLKSSAGDASLLTYYFNHSQDNRYVGKHDYVGKHSSAYFERKRR